MPRTEMGAGGYNYRFTLTNDGKILTVDQYDDGSGKVDGDRRDPQWVTILKRCL
jgi:hypothetical protein